jgi:Zn-finger nucleic acid-binding protein
VSYGGGKSGEMNCPLCKSPMIVLELEQVEVDHCTACGGIWLDRGELELLFGDAQQACWLVGSFRQASDTVEKIRRCPICLKKMAKIFVGISGEPVVIDKCSKSHGLWFDRGELPEVLAKGSFDKEQKVIKLLSEIFNHDKSEVKNDG